MEHVGLARSDSGTPFFAHETEALRWYEKDERVLTPRFLATVPWGEVKRYPIDPKFFPVLTYMRDVEKFTDIYFQELTRTPTGRDPVVRKFMERWAGEESLHGDLLNRFLIEAGYPTTERWYEQAKQKIPVTYKISSFLTPYVTNCFGKHFSAVHMTWGAVNELSTLNGYQRLAELARHPVLKYLLDAISREEARHALFYWSIARIKLVKSKLAQELTRFIITHVWSPVGQGTKPKRDADYVIATLFGDERGVRVFDRAVNKRVASLPGLQNLTAITDRITRASGLTPVALPTGEAA